MASFKFVILRLFLLERGLFLSMDINLRKIGELCIIDLPQNIFSQNNSVELKNVVNNLIDDGYLNILLNMANIAKIDGTGLGVLLNLQKTALYNEINIRLYGLQPYVAQIMFQTRLNKIFDICQNEDNSIFEEAFLDTALIA